MGIFPEPIDVKDPREPADMFPHIEPVGKVVTHVVAAEGEHGHRIASDGPYGTGGRGSGFGTLRGT